MKAIWTVGFLLATLALAPLDVAWAQAKAWRPVSDDIKFFSARAREQADAKISEIKSKFQKDLFIEAKNAPTRPSSIDKNDKVAINQFFDRLAEKRFEELRENGIYVMIIDDPHILRVVVGNNTIAKGYFTKSNRDELIGLLRTKLHDKDHDGALLAGTKFVYDTMLTNHPGGVRKADMAPVGQPVGQVDGGHNVRPTSGFNWSPILTIVLVGVGVWVLFAIVRSLFRGASGGGAPGMGGAMGGGGGGGGFMTSLLGGMFGAAAGMWMYNSFFGGSGGSSALGSTPDAGGGSSGGDAADTSGSVGGADYGDNGGGDVGGGDAGGGDWGGGGGDWGGGGGDFGGGGGGGDW